MSFFKLENWTTLRTLNHQQLFKMNFLTKFLLVSAVGAFIAVKWTAPKFQAESLRGARVLVTGASMGIGEEIAYHYARFGAQIVITARRENVLKQVVDKCLHMGAQKALYIAADMANDSEPDRVVKFTLDKLGGLDYLVLNHIGTTPFTIWDGDVEHIRWLMKVNFFSYAQMAWAALPSLEQSKGSLVVVSSVLGKMSTPFTAPYTSTKCALNGFFGALRHELAMKKSNVSISICTLGVIDTETTMNKIRGVVNITAYPASEAAMNIVITGATRQPELFYPWFTQLAVLSKDWWPFLSDFVIRNSYNYSP